MNLLSQKMIKDFTNPNVDEIIIDKKLFNNSQLINIYSSLLGIRKAENKIALERKKWINRGASSFRCWSRSYSCGGFIVSQFKR